MKRLAIYISVPVVIAATILYLYLSGGRYVVTENAYIRSGIAMVSAGSAGHIKKVLVQENQYVEEGELLFVLDLEPFDLAVDHALAELEDTRNTVALLISQYHLEKVKLSGAEEDLIYAQQELDRVQQLRLTNAVSAEKLAVRQHELQLAKNNVSVAVVDVTSALAQMGGKANRSIEDHSRTKNAQVNLAEAKMDQRRASVLAGVSGTIAKIDLHPGEFVQKGQAVFSIVNGTDIWIEANLKETQMTHIAQGQIMRFEVEAYPEIELTGKVDSIAPASGAEFAILPPQNATGNWVKITQRIPVRLTIDKEQTLPHLRAGMSVTVSIDTQQKRSIKKLLDQWFS